jgi:hypothetical protein
VRTAAAAAASRRRRRRRHKTWRAVVWVLWRTSRLIYHRRERARVMILPMTERNGRCSPAVKIADSSSGR